MKNLISYIFEKYNPNAIILYGSYANGTNNANSDFDVLVISNTHPYYHDVSFVDGVQLDLFVYPKTFFKKKELDLMDFVQIFDGKIIFDNESIGLWLKTEVNNAINDISLKTYEENRDQVEWCEKMLVRALRNDAEGHFRFYWVLIDSLEIYFDICSLKYFGPKKALNYMKKVDSTSYEIYSNALETATYLSLEKWINKLRNKLEKNRERGVINIPNEEKN